MSRRRRLDLHRPELARLAPDLPKTLDQGFNFRIAGPDRDMHRDGGALLRSDTVGGDRPVRAAQEHPAPDEGEGPEQDAQRQLDDGIQRTFLVAAA